MPPELAFLLDMIRTWAPSAVTAAAAIGINRRFKAHDELMEKVNKHETRLAVVETRCEERGSC